MHIGLIGSAGKMGKAVKDVVKETSHEISASFDMGQVVTKEAVTECDILIDFSVADALETNLNSALQAGIPLVTGTTGWYDQKETVKRKVEDAGGAFLYASNFSIGILLFHKLLARTAELYSPFEQYDFAIHEIHHNQKTDSPSGTALTLADEVIKKVSAKTGIQTGNPKNKLTNDKLHISSTRVGSVPGIHSLYVESLQDSIEVTHRAKGRLGFASGAVKAAEWLIGKKGFYSMDDVIKTLIK